MATLLDAYKLFHEGTLALAECERVGIRIDVEYCREKIAWLDEQTSRYDRRLKSSVLGKAWLERFGDKTNFGSNLQLQAVLYVNLGAKSFKKTASEQDSVDEESLKQIQVDGIDHLLRQRSLKKMSDVLHQFVRYQLNGRLYPNFNLHTAVTYRSSSSDPNLQNVPTRDKEQKAICRRAIVASLGNVLLEIDFKSIEVGIAACLHKDPTMLAYLRNPASDMHADQAKELFLLTRPIADLKKLDGFSSTLRQAAKNGFVFPQFYGDYYVACAQNVACNWCKLPRSGEWAESDGAMFDGHPMGWHMRKRKIKVVAPNYSTKQDSSRLERLRRILPADAVPGREYQIPVSNLDSFTEHVMHVEDRMWNERFPVYSKWRKEWYASYQREGRFRMKTGFVCSGIMERNKAVNYPVQGAAFHVLLKTLTLLVQRIRGWRSKVIGEVHDSTLVDADPAEVSALIEMVSRIASEELPQIWPWIIVPLSVESSVSAVDGSWAEMKEVK